MTIKRGATYTFNIGFSPNNIASYSGQFTATDAAGKQIAQGSINGLGISGISSTPQLTVSTATLAFGSVTVNTVSTQPVTLTSTGTAPVTITSALLSGTGFSMSGATFPVTLNPTQSVTLNVQFDPTTLGTASGQITIQSDSSTNGTAVVNLSGTGTTATSPQLTVSAATLAFGSVTMNTASTQPVTLTSTGTAPVTITSALLSGTGFTMSGATFPVTLNPTQSVTLNVQFDPTTAGTASGQLSIRSDSSTNSTAVVNLSGTGTTATSPQLTVSAATLAFGSVTLNTASTQPVTLTSTGTAPVTITSALLSGTGFTMSGATFPATLNPTQSVTLNVQFDPTTVGTAPGQLSIRSDSSTNSTAVVNLSGTGTTATSPQLTVSAATLAFGSVTLNTASTQPVTLTSTGTAPVTITSALLSGTGFTMSGATFPATLNPTQSVTLNVQFDPTTLGTASGQITIQSDSSTNSTAVVNLSGTGTTATQVYSVELLGAVTANQVSNGLGFVVPQEFEDWEFAAAAAAGATHVRFQCSWNNVEKQSQPPENTSLGFVQDPNCVSGFNSALNRGLKVTVVAAFGPPYHQILTVTVPNGAAVGATSLSIQFASGVGGDNLANIAFPYDYIIGADGSQFTGSHNYAGSFITGATLNDSTHATLTLSSAVTTALPASTASQYIINEILYPSVDSWSASDASIENYANYVSFLASDMASRGIEGEIEIWNEPPWGDDSWDAREYLYDTSPSGEVTSPNFGFAARLQEIALPTGVKLIWAGTEKSGSNSLMFAQYQNPTVTMQEPVANFSSESFHPYGNTPEQMMWTDACLTGTIQTFPTSPNAYQSCYLAGEKTGSNFIWAVQYSLVAQSKNSTFGIAHSITETGILPPAAGLRAAQARFNMRQFIGYQALGITPIEFYSIADTTQPTDPNFTFVDPAGGSTYTANASFNAISGFMADLKPIANLPVTSLTSANLASVSSYNGTYPLSTVHIVGSRIGATANSDMFVIWQRSYTPGCAANGGTDAVSCNNMWIQQASPAAGPVTVNIPMGMTVTSVLNVDTRAPVSYSTSGQQIVFNVADDPIEIMVDP